MKPLKRMTISALLAVLLVVSAYISIPLPISSVAFTAQSLMVMLIGLSMPVNIAFTSVGLYLLLGAIGLPVFSNGTAGLTILFGPTGGYLFGFLIGVVVMSIIKDHAKGYGGRMVAAIFGGIIVVYFFGFLVLKLVLGLSYVKALMIGVIPFLPLDFLKAWIAAWFTKKYQKHFNRMLGLSVTKT